MNNCLSDFIQPTQTLKTGVTSIQNYKVYVKRERQKRKALKLYEKEKGSKIITYLRVSVVF